jgi:hypothetical protein
MPLQFLPSRCINTLLAFVSGRRVLLLPRVSAALSGSARLSHVSSVGDEVFRTATGEISAALRRGLLHGVRHVVDQFTGRAISATVKSFGICATRNRFCATHPLGVPRVPGSGRGNLRECSGRGRVSPCGSITSPLVLRTPSTALVLRADCVGGGRLLG